MSGYPPFLIYYPVDLWCWDPKLVFMNYQVKTFALAFPGMINPIMIIQKAINEAHNKTYPQSLGRVNCKTIFSRYDYQLNIILSHQKYLYQARKFQIHEIASFFLLFFYEMVRTKLGKIKKYVIIILLYRKIFKMKEFQEYKQICQIGQGAFGRVYKAVNAQNKIVAIKHIKFDSDEEGIPSTALRQISLLKTLKNHPNIVPLLDIQYKPKQKSLKIVFDYYDYDLKKYLQPKEKKLSEPTIKSIIKQILQGICFCHCRKVLHRDMKPQNILIDVEGNVKIADFGLARLLMIPIKTLTHEVETLWYRAPEILLGQQRYTFAVDVWAVGCIFAELYTKRPLFLGNGYEIQQIFKIFEIMGTPSLSYWGNLANLPDYKYSFPKWTKQPLQKFIPEISALGLDLLQKMLELNPDKRISAAAALQHEYFKETNVVA